MNTFSKQLLTLATLTALSTPVFAQGFYLGASAGQAQADEVCDDIDDLGFAGSCDDDDTGWKLNLGYQFTPYWGVEAFYVDFGELADAEGTVLGAPVTVEADVDGYGAALVGTYPIGDFSLFGKVGFISWDSDASVTGNAGSVSADDDGTDAMFGLGAGYSLTEQLSLRAEWEYYDEVEADLFSAGFVYKFF